MKLINMHKKAGTFIFLTDDCPMIFMTPRYQTWAPARRESRKYEKCLEATNRRSVTCNQVLFLFQFVKRVRVSESASIGT